MPELQIYDQQQLLTEVDPSGRLERYYQLLAEENSRINLVSRETLPMAGERPESGDPGERFAGLRRLAAESLYPLIHIPEKSTQNYLDIGAGGGLPSIPVILTRHPDRAVLVERTLKKAAALNRMVKALDCQARIEPKTFEELALPADSFDLITLRLVRLTEPLLKKILKLLHSGGSFVYYSNLAAPIDTTQFALTNLQYSGSTAGDIHTATVIRRNR